MSKKTKLEDALYEELAFHGLPLPFREYRFSVHRDWRADFAWPDRKILVEVQGGLFIGGGHNRGAQIEKDYEKANTATMLGWYVFHFGPVALRRRKRGGTSDALAFLSKILKPNG